MDPIALIPSIISGIAVISIGISAVIYNTPDSYVEITGTPLNLESKPALSRMHWFTVIVSILQVGGSAFMVYEKIHFDLLEFLPHCILGAAWLLLALVSSKFHQIQNAQFGGHLSLFLVVLILIGGNIAQQFRLFSVLPIVWTVERTAFVSQVGVAVVFLLVLGFWSSRHEMDNEEFISYEKGASILSQLTFSWLSPMIKLGNERPLEQTDIWNLVEADTSEQVLKEYYYHKNPDHSLYWNICKVSIRYVMYQFACSFLSSIASFAGPFFLYQIVNTIQIPGVDRIILLPQLLCLFLCASFKAVVDGQLYFTGRRLGTRARTILVAELYNKSLHRVQGVSSTDEDQSSLGKIVTLMSVDTERIRMFLSYVHDPFIYIPLTIAISIAGLFGVLGWSAFVGIALIIIIGPISTYLGKVIIYYQEELLKNTDARVTIMNEVLQGIRIIKYFAWEKHFAKKVEEARAKEIKSIITLWSAYIGFGTIGSGSSIIIAFGTFSFYTLFAGHRLDTATAFTAVNLLNVVSNLLAYLPTEIMNIFKAKVSLDRIDGFLKEQDIAKYDLKAKQSDEDDSESGTINNMDIVVGFKGGDFSYYGLKSSEPTVVDENQEPTFSLKNLDAEFPIGGLSVVCGPTGSGKTSLLLALLGEMQCNAGKAYLPKIDKNNYDKQTGLNQTIAYAAQTAWLLNATVRENITFGHEYDPVRYEKVVRACALAKDFENLDGGDLTEIGEKGINLSGGQKQRISLARACYSPASIVLLDDPLSAVDAPTARYLLHKCILGVLKGRTVVLVSHATHLVVPFADYIVSMKNGEIVNQGAPIQLVQNPEDESLFGLDLTRDEFEDIEESEVSVITAAGNGTTLVEDEEKATGAVSWSVYRLYFKAAGGVLFFILFMCSFFLSSGAKVGNDWWLKKWTDFNGAADPNVTLKSFDNTAYIYTNDGQGTELIANTMPFTSLIFNPFATGKSDLTVSATSTPDEDFRNETFYYLGIYAAFGASVVLANNLQSLTTLVGALFASRRLHTKLLNAVMYSPLRFFETTPIGRILNRFSKDIENIDSAVMDSVHYFINQIIQAATIITVIGSVAPVFLLATPFIAISYIIVAKRYLETSRELKRFESTTRSPTYAQFSETLAGVCTIRAYGQEERFADMNKIKVDGNHKPFFYVWAANRWLCLRTDLISAIVVLCAGLAVVFTGIPAGWAALCISYSLDFTNALLWTVRMHAEMEMNMNSVERVEEYSGIEQEPPAIIESNRPDPSWPSQGAIQVKDVSIRYAPELPDVLKNVSFAIRPHEKVAVVGRTGAGKSTLSLAFFRILPISSGSIHIDGVDINQIGLFDLRSRLTIIPQDPVLFTGTLRSNLDPLEQNDDQTLWEALKRVHFLESMQQQATAENDEKLITIEDSTVASSVVATDVGSGITLDYTVTENGGNFSQGQRQLLCLARSLIQRNKVIFLDEATASVDNETDAKIQGTIRKEFADSTIICIAHRLRTVIDYDKILVLDKGQVLEFGSPLDLIEKSNVGAFRSMCEETGEFEELVEIARIASANGKFKANNY